MLFVKVAECLLTDTVLQPSVTFSLFLTAA